MNAREGIVDIAKRVDSTESGAVQLPTKCGLHDAGWEFLGCLGERKVIDEPDYMAEELGWNHT
jgi:hypothetical protein